MRRHFTVLALLALLALLAACGGGGSGGPATGGGGTQPGTTQAETSSTPDSVDPSVPSTQDCSVAGQRTALDDFMVRNYFWWDHLRPADRSASTLPAYFESQLYRPTDRFSNSEASSSHARFFEEGRRIGFGYTLAWDDAARTLLRVRSVEPASPAGRAGLKRGDVVFSVDGLTPQQVGDGALAVVETVGVARRMVVGGALGPPQVKDLVSADFPLEVVTRAGTLPLTRGDGRSVKVGYLAFNSFVTYGRGPLGDAMRSFAAEGVTDVVLDMRYNGGGSVLESRDLASMLGGAVLDGQVFAQLRFNSKNPGSNQSLPFVADASQLPAPALSGLTRLIVIASANTASASELVINSLKPYMPVILVGTTTYGKPYGFVPQDICGITYNAVQFESVNARGEGQYTAGFAPTCQVGDDLGHDLGDPAEARLKAALYFAAHDRCPAVPPVAMGALRTVPDDAVGEGNPARMVLK